MIMIVLPFVFFVLLFICNIKKRGLDVYVFIILLYAILSFFSILLDATDLYSEDCLKLDLGFVAPILYCILLYVCIKPFSNVKTRKIDYKTNDNFIKKLVYFYFAIFLILLVVAFTRIQDILLNNAFDEVRRNAYSGENASLREGLNGIPRIIVGIAGELASSSYIMILIFFFNVTYKSYSISFNTLTLLSSCSQLLSSMIQADRSQFFYWILLCAFAFTIFHKNFGNKAKRYVFIILVSIVGLMIAYLLAVTISRFSYRDSDTSGGMINYLGQSYINFCNFLNYLRPNSHSLCELFPITTEYILHGKRYFEFCEVIYKETHMIVYGFSSFLGFIFSMSGLYVMLLFVLSFRVLTDILLKRLVVCNLRSIIQMWCLALVPILGVFTHFYAFSNTMFALIIWLYIAKKVQIKSS